MSWQDWHLENICRRGKEERKEGKEEALAK
jgi:hypothetical protein